MKKLLLMVAGVALTFAIVGCDCKIDRPGTESAGALAVKVATGNGNYICYNDGDGSPENPYIVRTPAELDAMRNNLCAHYRLGNNIDLTSYLASGGAGCAKWNTLGWEPIGNSKNPFSGTFDGAGCKITGLWINRPSTNCIGLFGFIGVQDVTASVINLGVEIANGCGGIRGNNQVGGIAGGVGYGGCITNCYVWGNVCGVGTVGGVAGDVAGGYISNCYTTGNISGTGTVGRMGGGCCYAVGNVNVSGGVGGVAGSVYLGGCITNCYATGNVTGNGWCVGGVAGWVSAQSNITCCYASGYVSNSGSEVGGVAGYVQTDGVVSCCVALNPDITTTTTTNTNYARLTGYCGSNSSLYNCWAQNAMTLTSRNGMGMGRNSVTQPLGGTNCAAIPEASWWTTPAPNGPGWCHTVWNCIDGQLPKLQWQQ